MPFVRDVTPEMLREDFQSRVNPRGTYEDVERFLKAKLKRARRHGAADYAEALAIMVQDVRGAHALVLARRAALPKLRPWHGL